MSDSLKRSSIKIPENNYKKNKHSIGDVITIGNIQYIVKQIYDKGEYNMYFCKDILRGFTTTITDKD